MAEGIPRAHQGKRLGSVEVFKLLTFNVQQVT